MPGTVGAAEETDRVRCPAGGPGCDSRARELHVHNGPMGARVGYYTPARAAGWVSAPFTVPPGAGVSTGAGFTDQLGRPLEVGTRGALGAVLWSRSGRVVGLGKGLVHVQWSRERYDQARRYHAMRGEQLRIREP